MSTKYILFLSTTPIWGGSEVLWTQSARELLAKGYKIKAGLRYPFEIVKSYLNEENYIDFSKQIQPPNTISRVIQKLKLTKFRPRNLLHDEFKKKKPDLTIISQGNNIESIHLMKDCVKYNVPFITISHLVTPDFWPGLNDEWINEIIELYRVSKCNYFVSRNSMSLHDKMLGSKLNNSAVLYNPFIKTIPPDFKYPNYKGTVFKVALVGRIECFHKGYDLLIDVLKKDKWKNRPIHFSLFGHGPHVELLNRLIVQNNIVNMTIHSHIDDIAKIWQDHQILLMPSRMEGQSLSLIEAMKFSRSAIVTNVGGTAELIEDGINGFIAAYPSPESIDDALERAWEKRDEWEQFGINAARSIAEKHPADALSFFNDKVEALLA